MQRAHQARRAVKTIGMAALAPVLGCGDIRGDDMQADAGGTAGETSVQEGTGDHDDADGSGGVLLDIGGGSASATVGDGMPSCQVTDDLDGTPSDCEDQAPPDSFTPEVQWTWTSSGGHNMVLATPLVANLTDDNGDGVIDLCDTPDVIIAAMKSIGTVDTPSADPAYVYVLDGATGQEHFMIDMPMVKMAQPAVGDVDGDGVVEIVAIIDGNNTVGIFANDGTLKKQSIPAPAFIYSQAIALYDLEADGDVEILVGGLVYDHEATFVWPIAGGSSNEGSGPVAVDQVMMLRPTGESDVALNWARPAAVHDFDATVSRISPTVQRSTSPCIAAMSRSCGHRTSWT